MKKAILFVQGLLILGTSTTAGGQRENASRPAQSSVAAVSGRRKIRQ
jgi:hypothetical protein